MIAKVLRGANFAGLHADLTSAMKVLGQADVRLVNVCSLATAAGEMRLNAARSARIEKPLYHIILAWGEAENPTPTAQLTAAERLLGKIGLAEHQAVVVRYSGAKAGATPGAGRHSEIHMMVNRVGPHGKAAKMSRDYAKVEKAVAEIAAAEGFLVVPGRFNGVGALQATVSNERSRSFAAASGRPTVGAELANDPTVMAELCEARLGGWSCLLRAFDARGIIVTESDRKPRANRRIGLVLIDRHEPQRREKISRLDTPQLKWGQTALERDLGQFPGPLAASQAGAADPSLIRQPDGKAIRACYAAERDRIIATRKVLQAQHKMERDAHFSRRRDAIESAIGLAKRRRALVQSFFDRRSLAAKFINAQMDRSCHQKLQTLYEQFESARKTMVDLQKTSLATITLPTWGDWNRRQLP